MRGLAALTAGALIGLVFLACGDDEEDTKGGSSGGSADAEPLFRALEEDLIASCGGPNGTCHVRGSYQKAPAWLGGVDPYETIKKYRGMIPATREPGDSIILTQVRHAGPALTDAPNDLYRRVADWLTAEVPQPALPNTGAFFVTDGFNSVNLDTVGSGLAGAKLSFLASENNGTLTLAALRLTAPINANVKIDSPFFTILPRNGKVYADPDVNGFKGELTIPAGTSQDLFTGKMILLRWDPAGRLKISFQKIESTPGQGNAVGCVALEQFKSSAIPALNMEVDLKEDDEDAGADPEAGPTPLGRRSCVGCHAVEPPSSEPPSVAVNAMDLRGIDTDPAKACAQARLWINFKDKANSQILNNPQGKGNPNHPTVPVTPSDPIVQGLKVWVDAEQEK